MPSLALPLLVAIGVDVSTIGGALLLIAVEFWMWRRIRQAAK